MADERPTLRDRAIDVGWIALLLGAALAIRQRSAVFHVLGFAVIMCFFGWQTVAKLTRRRTRFDTPNSHLIFFLTAALMVFGGGAQVVAPQPNAPELVRVLGGFICLGGLVMIAAEARDFEPWLEERRIARDER